MTTTAPVLLDAREIAQMMRLVRWNEHPAFDLRRALGMNSVKRAMASSVPMSSAPPRQERSFAPGPGPGAGRPAVRDADPVTFAPHIRAQAWEWALGHIQILVFTTKSFLDVEEGPASDSTADSGAPAPETPPSAGPPELEKSPTTDVTSPAPLREWPQPTSPRSADADPSDSEWRTSWSQAPTDRGRDPWTAFNSSNTSNTKSKKTGSKVSTRRRDRENLPPARSSSQG